MLVGGVGPDQAEALPTSESPVVVADAGKVKQDASLLGRSSSSTAPARHGPVLVGFVVPRARPGTRHNSPASRKLK